MVQTLHYPPASFTIAETVHMIHHANLMTLNKFIKQHPHLHCLLLEYFCHFFNLISCTCEIFHSYLTGFKVQLRVTLLSVSTNLSFLSRSIQSRITFWVWFSLLSFWSSSILRHTSAFHSFQLLSSTKLYGYAMLSWTESLFGWDRGQFWIMLLWLFGFMCFCEHNSHFSYIILMSSFIELQETQPSQKLANWNLK